MHLSEIGLTVLRDSCCVFSASAALSLRIDLIIFLWYRRCSTLRLFLRSSSFRSYRNAPSTATEVNASRYYVDAGVYAPTTSILRLERGAKSTRSRHIYVSLTLEKQLVINVQYSLSNALMSGSRSSRLARGLSGIRTSFPLG